MTIDKMCYDMLRNRTKCSTFQTHILHYSIKYFGNSLRSQQASTVTALKYSAKRIGVTRVVSETVLSIAQSIVL